MEKIAPADRASAGPFDVSEIGVLTPYLDFGSIRLAPRPGMQIRADVEENSKRVIALTLEIDKHRMQLQAFASTKNEGLWLQTMEALANGIQSQGGSAEQRDGILGMELKAEVPVVVAGNKQLRQSVFVGTDGPRWFLRGVLSGPDIYGHSYEQLIAVFRSTAVNRGDIPMPPGDLLPLRLPTAENEQ